MLRRRMPGCLLVPLVVACTAVTQPDPQARTEVEAEALLPILRQWSGDGPVATAPWCATAAGAAEWRALRVRLGPAADCLGSDFVPPAGSVVLAVVAPSRAHAAAAVVRVGTEEGVDVLTFSTVVAGAQGRPTWVLVVPARRQQLAVVLAMPVAGFSVPIETLLQVFEPR